MKLNLLALVFVAASACQNPPPTNADGGAGSNRDSGTSARSLRLSVSEHHAGSLRPHGRGWVAGKDGDGGWEVLTGADGGYALLVRDPGGRYQLAVVCGENDRNATRVYTYDATVDELPAPEVNGCQPKTDAEPLLEVTLVTQNVPAQVGYGQLAFAGTNRFLGPSTSTDIQVPAGRYDLFASVQTAEDTSNVLPEKMVLAHDILVNAAITQTVDFSTALSQQPMQVSATGLGAANVSSHATLFFRTEHQLPQVLSSTGTLPGPLGGFPLAVLAPGDLHFLSVTVLGVDGRGRGVYRAFREPLTVSVTPPAYLTSGAVSSAGTAPAVRPAYTWSDVPADSVMLLRVSQGAKDWTHIVTPGALGNATRATVPDLSGVPGWNPSAQPLTGVSSSFSVEAAHGNRGLSETLHLANDFNPTVDGAEVTWVSRSGTVTF